MASRERLTIALRALGFDVLQSSANFLFARHRERSGADLAAGLRDKAVLVRHFPMERIENYLRISIGTDAECDKLLAAFNKYCRIHIRKFETGRAKYRCERRLFERKTP